MKLRLMQKLTMAALATLVLAPVYGTVTGPGTISSLSANAVDRSGYLEILGSNFGGSGEVLIDGISAPVARWESTRIVAYVPETARLTTVPVQVVNESGQRSNTLNLTVTTRVANGRVKWRFQADSLYILQRPAVGADGTVVFHDSSGNVYALKPDGSLKWIFKTRVFAAGPPSIGLDGTVYVADSSTITAIKPNGSLKWTFTEPPGGQGVIAGPTVGPDGNIYAVTDIGGLGALALSPAGQLLWSNSGDPVMAEQGQLGVEMSFGPSHPGGAIDQFYVAFDDFGSSERNHMYAFSLTGEQVWTIPLFMTKSDMMQQERPIVGPDGTVFLSASVPTGGNWSLNAFDPASGTLLRSYFPSPGLSISVPTVGPDGKVYFGQSLSYLQGVTGDFVPLWTFFDGSILSYPVVSPANDIVFTGGAPNFGVPGFVRAFSTSSGQLLWSLDLGVENGGNQNMQSIPRFTPDGSTVYFGTSITGEHILLPVCRRCHQLDVRHVAAQHQHQSFRQDARRSGQGQGCRYRQRRKRDSYPKRNGRYQVGVAHRLDSKEEGCNRRQRQCHIQHTEWTRHIHLDRYRHCENWLHLRPSQQRSEQQHYQVGRPAYGTRENPN